MSESLFKLLNKRVIPIAVNIGPIRNFDCGKDKQTDVRANRERTASNLR